MLMIQPRNQRDWLLSYSAFYAIASIFLFAPVLVGQMVQFCCLPGQCEALLLKGCEMIAPLAPLAPQFSGSYTICIKEYP